jgi:hypothetical protein
MTVDYSKDQRIDKGNCVFDLIGGGGFIHP